MDTETETFGYSGSKQTLDISHVREIDFELLGAGGEDGGDTSFYDGGAGGKGGKITGSANVDDYSTLEVWVGGRTWGRDDGGNGTSGDPSLGGDGAGSTEIRADGNRIATADGGGGGGGAGTGTLVGGHGGGGARGGEGANDAEDGDGSGGGGDGGAGSAAGGNDGEDGSASAALSYGTSVTTGGGNTGTGDVEVVLYIPEIEFEVEIVDVSPEDAFEGDTITVYAEITSTEDGGERIASLLVDGTTIDSKSVELDSGDSTIVSFEWDSDSDGGGDEYTLTVDVEDDTDSTPVILGQNRQSGNAFDSFEVSSTRVLSTTRTSSNAFDSFEGSSTRVLSTTRTSSNAFESFEASSTRALSTVRTSDNTFESFETSSIRSWFDWAIDSDRIDPETIEVTPDTLSIEFVVDRSQIEHWRQYERAGDVNVETGYGGSFRAVDRSGRTDAIHIDPPTSSQPPFDASRYYISDYSEEQLGPGRYRLELTAQRLTNRADVYDVGDQSGSPWTIDLKTGAISLENTQVGRIEERSGSTTGAQVTLSLLVSDEQAAAIMDSLGYPKGVVERQIPDGEDQLVDESGRQTMSLEVPPGASIEPGRWFAIEWTVNRWSFDSDHRWRIDLEIASDDVELPRKG